MSKDIKYKKGQAWNKELTETMEYFEELTGKNAIYNGKITGQFEYWLWQRKKNTKNILKQQKQDLEKSIRWIRTSKKWRTGEIKLGKLGEFKLRAYIHISEFANMTEYSVSYQIYDEESKKWLDYYSRTFKLPEPNDYEALETIRKMQPT